VQLFALFVGFLILLSISPLPSFSIKAVCDKLSDPEYVRQREQEQREMEQRRREQRFSQLFVYPGNHDPVCIGILTSTMRSERTSFEGCMADLSDRHRAVRADTKKLSKDDPVRESLALKFPAFMAETKLDGELDNRMIAFVLVLSHAL
jgi:hypothetical protein